MVDLLMWHPVTPKVDTEAGIRYQDSGPTKEA